jgi:hypothetical protein
VQHRPAVIETQHTYIGFKLVRETLTPSHPRGMDDDADWITHIPGYKTEIQEDTKTPCHKTSAPHLFQRVVRSNKQACSKHILQMAVVRGSWRQPVVVTMQPYLRSSPGVLL